MIKAAILEGRRVEPGGLGDAQQWSEPHSPCQLSVLVPMHERFLLYKVYQDAHGNLAFTEDRNRSSPMILLIVIMRLASQTTDE